MLARIEPGMLQGTIAAPPSKSMAHRMLICAALAAGESTVRPIELSEDILATSDGLQALGAEIRREDGVLHVTGCNPADAESAVIPCRGKAGTGGIHRTRRPVQPVPDGAAVRPVAAARRKRPADSAAHRERAVPADDAGGDGRFRRVDRTA